MSKKEPSGIDGQIGVNHSYNLSEILKDNVKNVYFPYMVDSIVENMTPFNNFFAELQSKDYELVINASIGMDSDRREVLQTKCKFPSTLRLAYMVVQGHREHYMMNNNQLVQNLVLYSEHGFVPLLTLSTTHPDYMVITINNQDMWSAGIHDTGSEVYSQIEQDVRLCRSNIEMTDEVRFLNILHPIVQVLLFMGISQNDINFNIPIKG